MGKRTMTEAFQAFLIEGYQNGNVEKALEYVLETVQQIGVGSKQIAEGKNAVGAMLYREREIAPAGYDISFYDFNEKIHTEEFHSVMGRACMIQQDTNARLDFRITANGVLEEDGFKIGSMHLSLAHGMREDDRFFLLCTASKEVEKSRREYTEVEKQLLRQKEEAERQSRLAMEMYRKYDALVKLVPGGIGIFRIQDGEFKADFLSEGINQMLGYETGEIRRLSEHNVFEIVHPDDMQMIKRKLQTAVDKKKPVHLTFRLRQKNGTYRFVMMGGTLTHEEENVTAFTVFTDVDELVRSQRELAMRDEMARMLLDEKNTFLFDYDCIHHVMQINLIDGQGQRIEKRYRDFEQIVQKTRRIWEPDKKNILRELKKAEKGIERGTFEYQADLFGIGFRWYRIVYEGLCDERGVIYRYIGKSDDIQKEKESQERYQEECQMSKELSKNYLVSCVVNLSLGRFERIYCNGNSVSIDETLCSNDLLKPYCEQIVNQCEKEQYKQKFDFLYLAECYSRGENHVQMEVIYENEQGEQRWVLISASMMNKPGTDQIVAFFFIKDIHDEKIANSIVETVADTNFEFICYLDVVKERYVIFKSSSMSSEIPVIIRNNENAQNGIYIENNVMEYDIERYRETMTLSNMLEHIRKKGEFLAYFDMKGEDGQLCKKMVRAVPNSSNDRYLAITRVDVTTAFQREEQKNKELKDALEAVQKANRVRNEFLSHMTHEIKTPMNAIVGLCEIAADDVWNHERVKKCLTKIGISAQYLMTMVNDVLDMSRVESKAVSLQNEIIDFRKFLERIQVIIGTQAVAKELEFHVEISPQCSWFYRGDELRLQQVLLNLLTNAVKFTDAGGTVTLTVEPVEDTKNGSRLRFLVADTGIGMSEAFLPKLFQPFSQEYHDKHTQYGGSGLGLAISKKLVELMDGSIDVKSEKGRGSLFCMEIRLEEYENGCHAGEEATEGDPDMIDYGLAGKRALIVEDHDMNTEISKILLRGQGMLVETAENGSVGLKMFAMSSTGYYDVILMDIRMPVMDGFEASRAIRALNREDALTVPIIAVSANAPEIDRTQLQENRMNGCISKPINRKLLYEKMSGLLKAR